MKRRTYNNMLKATKMIADKGYEWNKANEIAIIDYYELFVNVNREIVEDTIIVTYTIDSKHYQTWEVTYSTKEQIFDLKGVKVTSSRIHDHNMVESQINQGR